MFHVKDFWEKRKAWFKDVIKRLRGSRSTNASRKWVNEEREMRENIKEREEKRNFHLTSLPKKHFSQLFLRKFKETKEFKVSRIQLSFKIPKFHHYACKFPPIKIELMNLIKMTIDLPALHRKIYIFQPRNYMAAQNSINRKKSSTEITKIPTKNKPKNAITFWSNLG